MKLRTGCDVSGSPHVFDFSEFQKSPSDGSAT